jgi:predicted DNA-binding ribbon-helix-helix protein
MHNHPSTQPAKSGDKHLERSPVIKRSVVIAGHKTSVSLEDAFWTEFREIARERNVALSDLMTRIEKEHTEGNLSSAIRVFVLTHLRDKITPSSGSPVTSRTN